MDLSRPVIRIDVGRRWTTEAAWLLESSVGGPIPSVDFDVLRAPVDLVIRNQNLTEALPDEPVVPLLTSLAAAVEALAVGRSTKSLIGLREAPWELAFIRRGPDVRIALYELAGSTQLVMDERVVSLAALRSAVLQALDDALIALRKAVPSRPADSLLEILREARARAGAMIAPREPDWTGSMSAPLVIETRAPHFVLRTRLDDVRGDLMAYDGEHRHDRHALLTQGVVDLVVDRGTTLRLAGRPLALLDSAASALARLVAGPWSATSLASAELARTPSEKWLLDLDLPRATLTHHGADGARHGADFDACDLVTALCDHMVDVLGACVCANPLLDCNDLVTEAIDVAERLRIRARQVLEPHIDPFAAAPCRTSERIEAVDALTAPRSQSAGDVRCLRYERTWTLRRAGLRRTLAPVGVGQRLFVSNAGFELVDAGSGEVVWRSAIGPRRQRRACVGPSRIVTANGAGDVVALDPGTGEVARHWSVGRSVDSIDESVDCTSSLDIATVVSSSDGRVFALGQNDRPRWSASVNTASRRALAVCADHVLAVSRSGGLVALRPDRGERAWSERVDTEDVQILAGPRFALVLGAIPLEGRGFVGLVDGATGRWQLRIEDAFDVHDVQTSGSTAIVLLADPATETRNLCAFSLDDGTPGPRVAFTASGAASARARLALCEGMMIVAEPRRISARSIRAPGNERWAVDPGSWGRPSPRIATVSGRAPLVAWANEAGIVVADARSGQQLAEVAAFWEQLDAVMFTDDGGLLVVERCGPREKAVHRLALAGMLAVVK